MQNSSLRHKKKPGKCHEITVVERSYRFILEKPGCTSNGRQESWTVVGGERGDNSKTKDPTVAVTKLTDRSDNKNWYNMT
jgi:hypothetical protein